ncbi:acyltransferase [Sediminicola luteus]|uniref:Acetyltransferase n=1 Tax=Sediminicola luteus TaxID=319238 RepID=A0A2A4GDM4_9FLAO|nr:DapH/DapD/GlmU-related protein [Sediminicola luteus]PCE66553.1 hypothetical protein B7P33_04455 [Sediminicola luteus]
MKRSFVFIICLIPINTIKIFLLRLLGCKVHKKAKIGLSIIFVGELNLAEYSSIGSFNLIMVDKLSMEKNTSIKKLNFIRGPFDLILQSCSGISSQNKIRRAIPPVTYGKASLILGINSFIVSNHFIDLTRSVTIGCHSIIAGIRTQIWTHGYYHESTGKGRIRIDGPVRIGDNVYVGSSCIFNPGVSVSDNIHIGAGSTISKNLSEPGMYVGQSLRFINNSIEKIRAKLNKIQCEGLIEEVYSK